MYQELIFLRFSWGCNAGLWVQVVVNMELRSSTVANESSGLFLIYFNDIIIFHFKLQQKTENIVKAVNIIIFITDDDKFFKHDLEIY